MNNEPDRLREQIAVLAGKIRMAEQRYALGGDTVFALMLDEVRGVADGFASALKKRCDHYEQGLAHGATAVFSALQARVSGGNIQALKREQTALAERLRQMIGGDPNE